MVTDMGSAGNKRSAEHLCSAVLVHSIDREAHSGSVNSPTGVNLKPEVA